MAHESAGTSETFERGVMTRGSDATFVVPDRVPDIAIDGFEGALAVNGLLRLNLVRFRSIPGVGKTIREVVATLTMTSSTANSFAIALLDALEKQGMLGADVGAVVKSDHVVEPELTK